MDFLDPGLLALIVAAFVAGTVDAVVGGGGLIQIPALFAVHPGEWAATLGDEIKKAQAAGDSDTGATYYRHWLSTLERLPLTACLGLFDTSGPASRQSRQIPRNSSTCDSTVNPV